MEYQLQLDKIYRFKVLIGVILSSILFIFLSINMLGIKGYALSAGLIFFTLLAPLLLNKYKQFLFVWILIVPFLDTYRGLLIGNTNVFTYFVTGLTFPVAIILIIKNYDKVFKDFPYVKYLFLLQFLILANIIRPDIPVMEIFNPFKFHFMEIFIIFCTYSFLKEKNNNPDKVLSWIAILAFINSSAIIFQRLTGMWLSIIEGIPRPGGIFGHPVDSSFFLNIFLPIGLYLFLKANTKKQRILVGTTIVISVFAILISLTKAAYITLAFNLFILFLYLPKKLKAKFIYTAVGLSILFIFVNYALSLEIIEKFMERLSNMHSWYWRLKIWGALINNINIGTFLIGNGINSDALYIMKIFPGEPTASHNLYIQFIYEYGILAWGYFLALFTLGFKFIKATLNKTLENRFIYIVPFLVISVILIDSMSNITAISSRTSVFCAWITMVVFYNKLYNETRKIKK